MSATNPLVRVAVYGASGFGRQIMPFVRMTWQSSSKLFELVFVDDRPAASEINGHAVLTYPDWIERPASERWIVIGISDSRVRERLASQCAADGVRFFETRAPTVVEMDSVEIGVGAVLCSFVVITCNVKIGRHFHANHHCSISHDCVIGDFVTLAPGVRCNGNVVIEDHAYIGAGAVIKQGKPGELLVIGRGAVVGMGAVVTKSVPAGVTVVGNPARPLVKD